MAQRITGVDDATWPDTRDHRAPHPRRRRWWAAVVVAVLAGSAGYLAWSRTHTPAHACFQGIEVDLAEGAHGGSTTPLAAAEAFAGGPQGRGVPRTGWHVTATGPRSGHWQVEVTRLGDGTYTVTEAQGNC